MKLIIGKLKFIIDKGLPIQWANLTIAEFLIQWSQRVLLFIHVFMQYNLGFIGINEVILVTIS